MLQEFNRSDIAHNFQWNANLAPRRRKFDFTMVTKAYLMKLSWTTPTIPYDTRTREEAATS